MTRTSIPHGSGRLVDKSVDLTCNLRHSRRSTQKYKLTGHRELVSSKIVAPRKPTATAHKWVFTTRIRPKVFSWRSSSAAVTRIKEAVAEIQRVASTDLSEQVRPRYSSQDVGNGGTPNLVPQIGPVRHGLARISNGLPAIYTHETILLSISP